MPAECTFRLNHMKTSTLNCSGFGIVTAYSGTGRNINNPSATDLPNDGPLPKGVYYIVDRESGGKLGGLRDLFGDLVAGTHRGDWFALYRNDDQTFVRGVRRGSFRLHPVGYWGISEGCITLPQVQQFEKLRKYLKSRKTQEIPGTNMDYYGRVSVE